MAKRKAKKKQSSNGIWIGMAVSAAILIMLCIALYLKLQPNAADTATQASSDANLVAQSLPKDLPNLGPSAGDGTGSVQTLFEAINKSKAIFRAGGFDKEKLEESGAVADALVAAGHANLANGFIDSRIGDKPFDSVDVQQDMQVLSRAVKWRTTQLIEDIKFDQASEIAVAYLALGRQMFEKNIRLKARQHGLLAMKEALNTLGRIASMAEQDGEISVEQLRKVQANVKAWTDAIAQIENRWKIKLKAIDTIASKQGLPNIADLIRIANEDQDRSFRIFAARRLGFALFERGDPGNQLAINAAIDELEKSSDALVATAAKAGRSIKDKAEYYELRK